MFRTRFVGAALPAALIAGVLTAAPGASAAQLHKALIRPSRTGFNHLVQRGFGSHGNAAGSAASDAESTNWSGYAATGSTYTSVSTSWIEPSVNCSATPNSYAAFWDGIDGYSSSTVEQTGTLAECAGRTAEYTGWYETYPKPMYTFGGAVNPNDVLTATVTAVSSKQFVITLADASSKGTSGNWSVSTTQTLTSAAALSSAEFIAEAPSSGSGILPLADFGTVSFSNPLVDGTALSSTSGVTPIEMVKESRRSVTLEALPSSLSSSGFGVTWES